MEGITLDPTGEFLLTVREDSNEIFKPEVAGGDVADQKKLAKMAGFDATLKSYFDSARPVHEIDYSGLCYDSERKAIWIVSDKARRLFLYDWGTDRVIDSAPLGYSVDGDFKEVEKVEGVAVDPAADRLYVVSDEEARLYVFDLRG